MAHIQIGDLTPRISYQVGASPVSEFEAPFPFFENGDLDVYVDGVLQILDFDYSVSGALVDAGGVVTFVTPIENALVTIVRNMPIQRTTDYPTSGPFQIGSLNTDLDKIVAWQQEMRTRLERTLRPPDSDPDGDFVLPPATVRANSFMGFGPNGEPVVAVDPSGYPASVYGASLMAAINSAAARVVLGMSTAGSALVIAADSAAQKVLLDITENTIAEAIVPTGGTGKMTPRRVKDFYNRYRGEIPVFSISGNRTVANTEAASIFACSAALTLTTPPLANVFVGFAFRFRVTGTGNVTLAPGTGTTVEITTLYPGQRGWVFLDGTVWKVLHDDPPNAIFSEEQTSGTSGGTFTQGAWQTRALNTTRINFIPGLTFASNQLTLPAGRYRVDATGMCLQVGSNRMRFHNVTDNAVLVLGETHFAPTGTSVGCMAALRGEFLLTAQKVCELQHRCSSTQSANGFGTNSGFGVNEVYSSLAIEKIA